MKSIANQQPVNMTSQDHSQGINPEALLMAAVQAQMAPEVIKQLLDMRRQLLEEQAREMFFRAKQNFKREVLKNPPKKTQVVRDRDGSERYRYAPIDEIQRSIDKPLTDNEFTYSWEPEIQNGVQGMACVLTHVMGHSQRSWFPAEPDPKSYMAQNQRIAATRMFACRYTLQDVTGVLADADTDGVIESEEINVEPQFLSAEELDAARRVLEQADDLQTAWRRIAKQVLDRGDLGAHAELKAHTWKLVVQRKQAEASTQAHSERASAEKESAPGIRPKLVTQEEAEKLTKRIDQMRLDWEWFLREFELETCLPKDIPAAKYDRYMDTLWALAPIREGTTYISLKQCKALHVSLSNAGITGEEFKAYHGLESTKDIPLSEYDSYMDFSGILADREQKQSNETSVE